MEWDSIDAGVGEQMEFNAEGEEIEIVPNFAQPEADLQFIDVRVMHLPPASARPCSH
jgi:hypothetical protein